MSKIPLSFTRRIILVTGILSLFRQLWRPSSVMAANQPTNNDWDLDDDVWRQRLSQGAYNVLRKEGTERPFSSELNNEKRKGIFACAGCQSPLFDSSKKFDSGTGWPSFWQERRFIWRAIAA